MDFLKKRMNTLTLISLIAIFIGSLGGIGLVVGQMLSSKDDKEEIISTTKSENINLKSQLDDLVAERAKLKGDLEKRDRKVNSQNETIVSLNNKLMEKTDYITDHLTGSSSIPHLEFKFQGGDDPYISGTIVNTDKLLPLINVYVLIRKRYEGAPSNERYNNDLEFSEGYHRSYALGNILYANPQIFEKGFDLNYQTTSLTYSYAVSWNKGSYEGSFKYEKRKFGFAYNRVYGKGLDLKNVVTINREPVHVEKPPK